MLATVKQLAREALRLIRDEDVIPVVEAGTLARPAYARSSCPSYSIVPRISEVVITFEVPGATAQNTELSWSADLHLLSLHVSRPWDARGDLRAVLTLTSDVDGSKGTGKLKDGVLHVRLPRRDVDTFTGLP